MLVLACSFHFAIPTLATVADEIESALQGLARHDEPSVRLLVGVCVHLWFSAKALFFPAVVIGLTFLVERLFTQVEREPKNYAKGAVIQAVFMLAAFEATMLTSRIIPTPDFSLFDPSARGGLEGYGAVLAATAVYLLAFDILLYWTHRAHHRIPFLWKFHSVHHAPDDLDALHNFVHPVELLVRYFTIVLPLSLLVQIDQFHFYVVFAFLAIQNQLNHMNVPVNFGILGVVFVDNRHHFIHHSRESAHYDRNFAPIFSFTDRLFGTYEPPVPGPLPNTGFGRDGRSSRVIDYLLARDMAPGAADRRDALPGVL